MTHIYIPKSSDMWCIHHYGSTEVNMHLDFLGPLRNILEKEDCHNAAKSMPMEVKKKKCDFWGIYSGW